MKRFVFCLSFCLSVLALDAQSVAHYFVQMPATLIPAVPIETRRDLIDFFNNGKLASMPSAFGGPVVLKEMDANQLVLQTSEVGEMQLKLLSLTDSLRVLALVHTVAAPLRDSRVRFYTTTWKPFDALSMPVFSISDFINAAEVSRLNLSNDLSELGPRLLVSVRFLPAANAFIASSSLKEDLPLESRDKWAPAVLDSIRFDWNGSSFVRSSCPF